MKFLLKNKWFIKGRESDDQRMLDIPVSLTVNFYWKLSQWYLVSIIVFVDVVSCKMDPLMMKQAVLSLKSWWLILEQNGYKVHWEKKKMFKVKKLVLSDIKLHF